MTDPTADAAKLLPCPCCNGTPELQCVGPRATITCTQCALSLTVKSTTNFDFHLRALVDRWNSRPQPAPPAGEPDFKVIFKMLEKRYQATYVPGVIRDYMPWIVEQAYRLGRAARPCTCDPADRPSGPCPQKYAASECQEAARPKVEDAEVAKSLETIANGIARALEAAEAKLAEREAELAKADAVAVKLRIGPPLHTHRQFWEKEYRPIQERHAARQQQKVSAEPTEGEGE